jgi:phosphoribosylglycinamide formyltransferase-1
VNTQPKHPTKLAVLISGRGSNLIKIQEAIESGYLNAQITLVISNKPTAAGLEYAKAHQIPHLCLPHEDYDSKMAFETAMISVIEKSAKQLDWVVLAGFMRVLSPCFINHFENQIINIHPSLLPKYKGLHTHKRALEAGDGVHGCSVHLVTEDLDAGPILAQAEISIQAGDTESTLAERLLPIEHKLLPYCLRELGNQDNYSTKTDLNAKIKVFSPDEIIE